MIFVRLYPATDEDFYQLFKQGHGKALGAIVKSCLQFENWAGHKHIGLAARAAFERIGKESLLNAIRVRRYGVEIEESDLQLMSPQIQID